MIETIPNGLPSIIKMFGDPHSGPEFQKQNIIMINLPFPMYYGGKVVRRTQCHRLAADNFLQAFKNLMDAGMDKFIAEQYNGIFEVRAIKGMPMFPSLHTWGIAGDWLSSKFPLGSDKRMPVKVINAFKQAGFVYGGDFIHRKDPMHFQLARGY